MFEPALLILSALPVLTTVYWACAVVGVGLVVVSSFGGSGSDTDVDFDVDADVDLDIDADVDVDVDADVDGDVVGDGAPPADGAGVDASALAAWFSTRFIVFFVAVFGLLGVVLTSLTQTGSITTLGISVAGGLVVGQGVHQLFRMLRRTSGNSAPGLADYVNQIGRVTIPIKYPDKGEITLTVRGGQRYIPAVSKHPDTRFDVNEEVAVVAYHGGAAQVVSRREHAFLQNTKEGDQA